MKKMKNIIENFKTSFKNGKDARRAIMPKILSLAVSFCIWFYVVSVESPVIEKTFSGVPVEVVLAEGSDLEPFSGDNETVDITVRGKRSALRSIDIDDIDAVLDVSKYTEAGEYNVRVDIETPSAATLVDQSVSEVKVFLDSYASKTMDVEVRPKNTSIDTNVDLVWSCEPSGITISGPESVISKVSKAQVEFDCKYNTEAQMHGDLNAVLLSDDAGFEENPYLKYLEYDSEVHVEMNTIKTKIVDLKLDINDLEADEYEYVLQNGSDKVTQIEVKGPQDTVNKLTEIVIESPYKEEFKCDIPLPEGVSVTEGQHTDLMAKVSLKYTAAELKNVPVEIIAPKGLSYIPSEGTKNVAIEYIPSQFNDPEKLEVRLVVELTETSTDGTYTVVPMIEGVDGENKFIVFGEVSVYVDITNEQ